jgi:SSS family solute:Na+ symporter
VSLSLIIGNVKGNLLEITFKTINILVAPLFIPFFMAMFIRIVKPKATFIGTVLSAVSALLISFSYEIFGLSISFLWIIPGSFLVGAIISIGLSILPFEKVRS